VRVLVLLSALALLSALGAFVFSGIPAALANRDLRTQIDREESQLALAREEDQRLPTAAALRELQERLASNQSRIDLLRQGLLPHDRTIADYLTSPEGPLAGFSGDRTAVYLELANQTIAVAARAAVPREQPFFAIKTGEEFAALAPAEQELLLQRTYLVYRVIECFAQNGVTDIRLLDVGASAGNASALKLETRRVTIVFAAPVEVAFATVAAFESQHPPPLTDLLGLRIERLDPGALGPISSLSEVPPVLVRWELNWLCPPLGSDRP
jgi:hypothetical protein